MTQREHTKTGAGTTQCQVILDWLTLHRGHWVSMPQLAAASGAFAVHSRVAELRSWGHVIEQRSERDGRKVRSFYRLVEGEA